VPGIRVGHWTDRRAATGCTVILCPPKGAVAGVDVQGGAPGTRETDLLRPGTLVERVHAIVLAGGSTFGLDAASGVMRYLEERGVGIEYGGVRVPIVPAAILFDLGVGRGDVRPTAESGFRAAKAAKAGRVEEGSVGAGTGATVAGAAGRERVLKGGIGTASERGPDGIIVGAVAAVNAAGDIIDPDSGRRVAGPRGDKPGTMLDGWKLISTGKTAEHQHGANTTLAVVATNAALSVEQANRLASAAHDGFARAIRPAHTMVDGDIVFTLATGDVSLASAAHVRAIEALAVRAVERAIVRGVTAATGLAGVPSVSEWRGNA
jgi:L-aminopeptidase/D-esterase-like protein